jgi:hypothetical protein
MVRVTGLMASIKAMTVNKLQEEYALGWVTTEVLNGDYSMPRHVCHEVEKTEESMQSFLAGVADRR